MKRKIAIFFGANYPSEGLAGVSRIQDMFKYITTYDKHLISPGKGPLRKDKFFKRIYIVGRHRPGLSMRSILANAHFLVSAILRFLRNNRKFKYKAIYATSPPFFPVLAAVICGKLTKTPVITDVRDPWATGLALQGLPSRSLVYKIVRILERFGYENTTYIIAVTDGLRELIRTEFEISAEKIAVVPNAADTEIFKLRNKSATRKRLRLPVDGTILIYEGSFAPYHNIPKLISVFSKCVAADIKTYLVLVGKKTEKLEKIGKEKKPNLILKKEMSREQIPYYISATDIGVVPLKQSEYSKYMIPLKLYEYAACGKPILFFGDAKESRTLIAKYDIGVVVADDDVKNFKTAVETLVKKYKMFSKNALKMSKKINRKNSAKRLEKIIDNLYKRKKTCKLVGEDVTF